LTERSLRIGVVGVSGGWSSEALADAMQARTGFRLLIDMRRCVLDLGAGRLMFDDIDLCDLDAIVVKKLGESYGPDMLDRLELLRYVESRGVAVFSRPASMLRLLDRSSCTVTLAQSGVPMPPTTITESVARAAAAVASYGEAVLKPLYSTKARGMQVVSAEDPVELERRLVAFRDAGNSVMYVQKKLEIGERDFGVVFLGGDHLGTYARVRGRSSWNTTPYDGGHYAPHAGSPELVALAWRAQSPFGLDLTSVDVVETADGPMVLEVSAFGGFRGSREALGLDLADRYARYALARLGAR
jgi:tetrahydromethanopterin:alpha-L-glutamate ligase